MQQFVRDHYDPARMRWFTEYEKAWSAASIAVRLPDRPAPQPRWAHDFISMIPNPETVIPGVPVYFIAGLGGNGWRRCAFPGRCGSVQIGVDSRDAPDLVRGDDGGRDECALPVRV